jgi:beta-glucosidase
MAQAPYLDTSLSFKQRAKDLVSRMTIQERASQLRYDAPAIERLGVPAYNWWNEALHGVARAGTATMFPQAIGLAATFDENTIRQIGAVIAQEGRAKYNLYSAQEDRDIYKGLTFWSPNVNIFRDPRWGRGHETYGEDPYLTKQLGKAFVCALQEKDEYGYMKAAACAKHFAVHSGPERLRHEFDAQASAKDLWETYLPAFEELVTQAKVEGVMGAYNRFDGEPCCASPTLMGEILRGKWGFDGYFTSDCWAIRDFHEHHKVTATMQQSAALALKEGCDINCGNTYLYIMSAYEEGLVSEEEITRACERAMTTRMRLGLFDDRCTYHKISYDCVGCDAHLALAQKAAERSFVLLKNDGILPLDPAKLSKIAVVGPNADSRIALRGNYHGTAQRNITVLEGIQEYLGGRARVFYSEGADIAADKVERLAQAHDRISEAVGIARLCDVVIVCLGLDENLEGEQKDTLGIFDSGDKKTLDLPQGQQRLLEALCETGKPVVLVHMTGSAMAIGYAQEHCSAILQAWYPGSQGGLAVARTLFGEVSPSGKLPVTFYHSTDDLPDFCDYSMKGRTYRYYQGQPLYPFGYGLSYGRAVLQSARLLHADAQTGAQIEVAVENKSDFSFEEVLQVYIRDEKSAWAVPNHSLCAMARIALEAGACQTLRIQVEPRAFLAVDDAGTRRLDSDRFTLFVGFGQPDARTQALTGQKALQLTVQF